MDEIQRVNKIKATMLLKISFLTVALFSITSCGTIKCLKGVRPNRQVIIDPLLDLPPKSVYGGVRWDIKNGSVVCFPLMNHLDTVLRFMDLPLSFVADTLILPYTLTRNKKTPVDNEPGR
ncbi:MAG: YceK/YidQ family lipoprotein [Lentisphaeria bacterium]|nr:YceK/YidQ family lipoprotein [Lentisphaeria bacterium]